MNIVVLGSGLSGEVIAEGLSNKFPRNDIYLIGESGSKDNSGLFYFNRKIPGIAEKPVEVVYESVGSGSFSDYQKKSRGFCDKSITTSSFDKIGKHEIGYLGKTGQGSYRTKMRFIRILSNASSINLDENKVVTVSGSVIKYDRLISTVPLNIFMDLAGYDSSEVKGEFRSTPVYQMIAESKKEYSVKKIKVFYDLSDSIFYRHSSYYNEDEEVVKMISESIVDFKEKNKVCIPGKIFPSSVLSSFVENIENVYKNVKLCGRYARWDYHYLVDQSYFDAIQFIEKAGLS